MRIESKPSEVRGVEVRQWKGGAPWGEEQEGRLVLSIANNTYVMCLGVCVGFRCACVCVVHE